jgi:16S rRNA (uracil1498-N3)-methyltransferase
MPRFFADIIQYPKAIIKDINIVRHISGPLRKRKGDEISIRDEVKGYKARISSVEHNRIVLEIIADQDLLNRSETRLHLAICLIDFKDMEDTIRYTTELGVSDIYPIVSARSNIRSISESRHNRWQAIVLEAVKQCERKSIPAIHEITPIEEFIRGASRYWGERLVAVQGAPEFISAYRKPDVGILIGPEGGFTREEEDMIFHEGFTTVSLGNTTLRAVTAAIAALSILGL